MPKKPADETPENDSGAASSPYAPAADSSKPAGGDVASAAPVAAVPPVIPSAAPPPPPAPYSAPVAPAPYPAATPYPYQAGPQKPPTVMSLLAMIFGIIGVALSCCYGGGFLFAVAGIVLGHLGRKRETAQGMALAGLITGYIGAGLSLVFWIAIMLLAFSPLLMIPFVAGTGV